MPEAQALDLPTDIPTEGCQSWPATYAYCGGECEAYSSWGEDAAKAQAVFEAIASDMLWNWTNRVFGLCETVIRPCQEGCVGEDGRTTYWGRGPGYDPLFPRGGSGPSTGVWTPVMVGGKWYNITCGCAGNCTCDPSGPTVLTLPGPVQSVDEVLIDGIVLDPTAYRVDRKRFLIRTDGGVWPKCQDMLAPYDGVGAFTITYQKGLPVPIAGSVAVGRLACELAASYCGGECALPQRITTVTRQGVSIGFQDLYQDLWEHGGTGIYSIDSWIQSVTRGTAYASVASIDTIRRG